MNPATIIMCKAPTPGRVKTRLAPFLPAEKAATLAACFIKDAGRKAQSVCKNTIVAFSGERNLLEPILPKNLIWVRQQGRDLGERMHNALRFAYEQDFSPVVVIGTDSPTLPIGFIENAIENLSEKRADAVLGKTDDGGYYLIGLNQPDGRIFQNVTWSSSETFSQTVQNINRSNLRLVELPIWYDVDTPEDLKRLKKEMETDSCQRKLAPATALWINQNSSMF